VTVSRIETTSARQSLWLDGDEGPRHPALEEDLEVDVLVLGGGITGLTTALLCRQDGASVAVLEADRVAGGVTACTTAKATALQATMYSTIRSHHGVEATQAYAEASLAAVERIAELADTNDIDCDLVRRPAFTYAAEESERAAVAREHAAATEAGLDAALVDSPDLPFPTYGAIRLDDQLELHPVRYVRGLAAALGGDGSGVYENTRAVGISEGTRRSVRTSTGATVRARHVVVATHYPVFDRGAYFARLEPKRSYCIAVRLASGEPPRGMSISAGDNTRSIRSYGDLLIVGGEGHDPGSAQAQPERYAQLESFAREHWDVAEVTHRWSAQDPVPYDHLPFVGPYLPTSKGLWVATGFMKWGITGGTFAAMMLADAIAGRDNPWAATFTPTRLSLRSTPKGAELGVKYSATVVRDRLTPGSQSDVDDLPAGEARVVQTSSGKAGVFRDDTDALHAVSVRCTHLGCDVRFNAAELSWDCPCHGSRFDVDGAVLEGPAVDPLEQRDLD
jgi:glycine/D-amino acid oxidase-like deaminating enzyme/nitrite reductase/ring-hydroxylating ferredoxin subunit